MAVVKETSTADILDRVLDKGIVIDGWLIVSVLGLDLIGVEGRMVVASLTTYAKRSRTVDRALGRRKIAPVPATAAEDRSAPFGDPLRAPASPPREATCPRCRADGKHVPILMVTVQAAGETRVTARCTACEWQHTEGT